MRTKTKLERQPSNSPFANAYHSYTFLKPNWRYHFQINIDHRLIVQGHFTHTPQILHPQQFLICLHLLPNHEIELF